MKVSSHENNYGALILARNLPQKSTHSSKYYANKTKQFRDDINNRNIALLKIATVEHLGDLFTKSLPRANLEYFRNKFMGW